jgi:hypothetical protein
MMTAQRWFSWPLWLRYGVFPVLVLINLSVAIIFIVKHFILSLGASAVASWQTLKQYYPPPGNR